MEPTGCESRAPGLDLLGQSHLAEGATNRVRQLIGSNRVEHHQEAGRGFARGPVRYLEFSGVMNREDYDANIRVFSRSMIESLETTDCYVNVMNDGLSRLLHLEALGEHPLSSDICQAATDMIFRLPAVPRMLCPSRRDGNRYLRIKSISCIAIDSTEALFSKRSQDFDGFDYNLAQMNQRDHRTWAQLVQHWPVDDNSLKIAIQIAALRELPDLPFGRQLQVYSTFLADLVHLKDRAFDKRTMQPEELERLYDAVDAWRHYITIAWQRASMLLFYYALGVILREGWSAEWCSLFSLPSIDFGRLDSQYEHPKYMCDQALALLRRSKPSVGLDLRGFFLRFETLFGHLPARCKPAAPDYVCTESDVQSCARFAGQSDVEDQSAHDARCDKRYCHRIAWSFTSFDAVCTGPRAVDIEAMAENGNKQLLYRSCDGKNLAISHVWSHGQGGRPESGINSCLHKRYHYIAQKHCCVSYWIDICCIPTDAKRRMEGIKGINSVFEQSRVTLICDKDIMSIDSRAQDASEDLLVTMIVSDWNVRAWTLLEGMLGCKNLHLLCQKNEVVPLNSILDTLYEGGRIALVSCMAAVQHLLPGTCFGYEDAGYLLGRRHASHARDETIIWSLISRGVPSTTPEEILQGLKTIRTGFLVSQMPRVRAPGFSWAPQVAHFANDFSGFDGDGSELGQMTTDGLRAVWLVHEIENTPRNRSTRTMSSVYKWQDLGEVLGGTTLEWHVGQPSLTKVVKPAPGTVYDRIALLQAKSMDGPTPYLGGTDPNEKTTGVLCGSHDGVKWHWIRTVQYNMDLHRNRDCGTFKLGDFEAREMLLV